MVIPVQLKDWSVCVLSGSKLRFPRGNIQNWAGILDLNWTWAAEKQNLLTASGCHGSRIHFSSLIIPITNIESLKTKNQIDTRTLVSIQSDSAGVRIFFTLDGSKPAEGQRGSGGRSRKYTDPILLPAGRVAVKAVAVTRDGRQSSVVTKIFSVDQAESDTTTEDKEDGLQTYQQHQSEESSCSAQYSAGSVQRTSEPRQNACSPLPPPSAPRFLNRRLGSKGPKITASAAWKGSGQRVQSANSHKRKQLSNKQVFRVQRDANFLWCPQCSSVRPSDPFARFCPQCGAVIPPLPVHKLPPAETEQMLLCASCHSLVPFNSGTCVVCEETIDGHWVSQDHVVCVSCGSWNPAQVSSCITCESRLDRVGQVNSSATSGWTKDGKMLSCSSCKRLNRSDAKFCDWCGRKPVPAISRATCWQCGVSGPWYGLYCMACGVFLEGQALPKPCNDITHPVEGTTHSQVSALPPKNSAPRLKVTLPSVDQSTQTTGIYYPSATELQKKEQQRTLAVIQQLLSRDRRPPLTAISPGRGFWRKQLDHISAHLRSYTQNNSSFRTLLAEPRLGQMISAAIQEDQDEITLNLSFMLAPPKQQQVGPNENIGGSGGAGLVGQAQTLSSVTEQSADRTNSRSAEPSGWRKLNANPKPGPSMTDCQLHKELGPDRGQISIIQQLLDQAQPLCPSEYPYWDEEHCSA